MTTPGKDELRLLGRATSGNVQKVVWLLEELGLAYRREDYGRQFANTADAAYRALNPTGKVPTLIDGGRAIWESNTILRYLAATAKSPLYPADAGRRSEIERWTDWQLASLNAPYIAVFRESRKAPSERVGNLATLGEPLAAELTLLDGAMGAWIGGETMSVADICLGPIVRRCLAFPIALPALPRLRRWHETIAARPAFARAVGA